MKLKIKPIVNGLFHATITQEGFEATAIGHTKDEAAKKALEWLKREIEISYKAEISAIENDDNDLEDIEDTFDADEQKLYSGEFLNGEVWEGLEEEVQRLAMQVAKVALKATLYYAVRGSIGGVFF
ncbi:hypothetical protein D0962_34645 [Leptolyngbyaceae cyanobacterium CCMR0082]|uniref:Uncharacterized protein n=1 Tax=Adonisia turfae CCMR0082 TaxID=2304604 RepID=A0A6M0SGY7_9CYAN|nr:hypothetical protein [Adonisia turfae]NEZ67838.1 hypothetical protein [Adonisia turfae CCMR0082]